MPIDWISRRVEVRETRDTVDIQLDARNSATHKRCIDPSGQRIFLRQHRPPRGQGVHRPQIHPEEQQIVAGIPEMADYVTALKHHSRKLVTLVLRQLLRMVREYPRGPLLSAVSEASRYGLYDLDRLERMVLRRIRNDYFLLDGDTDD